MPLVNIQDGVELFYEERGSGTPLLLVPGLGGAGSYWTPNLEAFSERYRVIIHDHRGTGRSTKSRIDYSVGQMASDLLALMDRLGIEKAHIVGHSTGGAMAQTLALDHPDRLLSAVLYATWTKADPFMTRIFEARKILALKAGVEAYVEAGAIFLLPPWYVNEKSDLLAEADKRTAADFPPVEIVISRIDGILAFDRRAELAKISTPTLVLGVADDILTPAHFSRELADAIPDSECVIVEHGGHALSLTRPDDFNRIVLEFIDRIETARQP